MKKNKITTFCILVLLESLFVMSGCSNVSSDTSNENNDTVKDKVVDTTIDEVNEKENNEIVDLISIDNLFLQFCSTVIDDKTVSGIRFIVEYTVKNISQITEENGLSVEILFPESLKNLCRVSSSNITLYGTENNKFSVNTEIYADSISSSSIDEYVEKQTPFELCIYEKGKLIKKVQMIAKKAN